MEEWAVTIQLRSRQTLDGETEELEQRAVGTLSTDGRVWCLRYREPGEEGGETSLTLRAGEAVLERAGSLATRLRFRTGAVCPGRLEMPAGALELLVETEYLGHALSEGGGRVMLRYRLSAQGQSMGRFTLQLRIRPAESAGANP